MQFIEVKLQKRISKDDSGCWIWTGNLGGKQEPRFRGISATRLVYEITTTTLIPENHWLSQTCGNRKCVNPEHQLPILRKVWPRSVRHPKKTIFNGTARCRSGHIYSIPNTVINSRGHRTCLECRRIRNLNSYANRKNQRTISATIGGHTVAK